jgi:hypothetical protein
VEYTFSKLLSGVLSRPVLSSVSSKGSCRRHYHCVARVTVSDCTSE